MSFAQQNATRWISRGLDFPFFGCFLGKILSTALTAEFRGADRTFSAVNAASDPEVLITEGNDPSWGGCCGSQGQVCRSKKMSGWAIESIVLIRANDRSGSGSW